MILSVVQARMTSTRLPGKVLMEIGGKPLLQWVYDALPEPKVVAAPLIERAGFILRMPPDLKGNVCWYDGDVNDVLERFYQTALAWPDRPDWILRACADSPMLTRELVERFIVNFTQTYYRRKKTEADWTIYTNRPWDPDGFDLELFSFKALAMAHKYSIDPQEREHVCGWMYRHLNVVRFSLFRRPPGPDRPEDKVSVDTEEDYLKVKALMEAK